MIRRALGFWLCFVSLAALADVTIPSGTRTILNNEDFSRVGTVYRPLSIYLPDASTHTMRIKAPASLASDSYTWIFPAADGSASAPLVTDGSGNLTFAFLSNASIATGAAIARTKLANGTASYVLINDGSGVMSEEAQLNRTRGGTGITSTATFPSSGIVVTEAAAETLTNKTINGASNTVTGLALTTAVTGTLPIANGGTNSAASLSNNRVMKSSGGAVVEAAAITGNKALASDVNGIPVASATTDTQLGYLSTATSDVQTQITARALAARLINTTAPLAGGGDLSADRTLTIPVATTSANGYLSSTDWNTFNGKQAAGNYITALTGDVTAAGPGSAAATVALVNGSSAANVHAAELLANAATDANTVSTIVKRDGSGNFTAGTVTANLTGNASGTAATITGVASIIHGGTGQTTKQPAFDALSPLTTKGDVAVFSTVGDRLPVGSNGNVLSADSTAATGLKWIAAGGTGTVTNVDLSMPGIFAVTGNPVTTTGTLTVAASGTSGGIPYFSGSTTLASSAALASNQVVTGGGAGTTPKTGGTPYIIGTGEAGTPSAVTFRGPAASGANVAGADMTFDASNGTGSGGSGKLIFRTAPVAASSSTANSFEEYLTIQRDGIIIIGGGTGGASPHTGQLFAPSGSGTNITGANMIIQPGNGTGTGASGHVLVQAAPPGSTGTTAGTMQTMIDVVGVSSGVASVSIGSTTTDTPIDIDSKTQTRAALLVQNTDTTTNSDGVPAIRVRKGFTTNSASQVFMEFYVNAGATNGGAIVGGAGTPAFHTISDRRLKTNISTIPPQLANIRALNPVQFDWKDGSGHQAYGFVAQEMQKIYAEDVSMGKNGYLGIAGWSRADSRLVRAIQELAAKNDDLEARVAALEKKLSQAN